MPPIKRLMGVGVLGLILLSSSGCALVLLPAAAGVGLGVGLEADMLLNRKPKETTHAQESAPSVTPPAPAVAQ